MISQNHRRRRTIQYEPLTYAMPKHNLRSKRKASTGKNSNVNIFDAFKIFASCILLASSTYTYLLSQRLRSDLYPDTNNLSAGFDRNFVRRNRDHGGGKLRTRSENQLSREDKKGGSSLLIHQGNDNSVFIPSFVKEKLNSASEFDTYGISHEILSARKAAASAASNSQQQSFAKFKKIAQEIREEFALRYGGNQAARAILQKTISTFSLRDDVNNIEFTAQRLNQARLEKRQFRFGFAGYSVTAGRGNYFNQSFPFVMERILEQPMKALGVDWSVVNAGIGGVPSLPYGLCLDTFLGKDPDVVFWDFAMNEANDSVEGFEAYIRRVASLNKLKDVAPMLMVKDTFMAQNRTLMLERYVEAGALIDPIVIHTDPAVDPFLQVDDNLRPIGFRQWREFGAPPDAPGKSRHHPAKKEHEFIGFIMAMHFLAALELLAGADMGLYQLKSFPQQSDLPPPVNVKEIQSSWTSILLGNPKDENGTTWVLEPSQCFTSFDPILESNLKDLIISENVQDKFDIMIPKGPKIYNAGWVLDLGDTEKRAKLQLQRYGGLGFVDSKKAYYGVYASGKIKFFLPSKASSVIVCESNEKKDSMSCDMEKDVSYNIGREPVQDISAIDTIGFTYLGRSICVHLKVPTKATMMTKGTSTNNESVNYAGSDGYILEVAVKSKKIRNKSQACNISHLIWL